MERVVAALVSICFTSAQKHLASRNHLGMSQQFSPVTSSVQRLAMIDDELYITEQVAISKCFGLAGDLTIVCV